MTQQRNDHTRASPNRPDGAAESALGPPCGPEARHPADILAPVHHLTLDELDQRWAEVEAAVDATPGIDPWCSGPDWQLPSHRAFAPTAEPLILAAANGPGFALLARYRVDHRLTVSGLEPLWGFGCPIVGPDPAAVAAELASHLADDPDWDTIVLPGLPPSLDDSSTTVEVAIPLAQLGRAGLAAGITRQVADLTAGYDAWLARRSARFRRNLRRARRAADDAGLQIVEATDDPELFDRLLSIELRSWKGVEDSGITGPEMTTMYRTMVDRLADRGRLVAHVATLAGRRETCGERRDVGYILGGLRARRYRGLQLSYTMDVADLSIGNTLQVHQLAQLAERGLADVYDLGMDIDYKRRWADRDEPSAVLVVER